MLSRISMAAFRDELEKIALSWKVKAPLALGGAAVGYGGYKILQKGKQLFIDEPHAQQQAALYGYTPYAVQQQQASPYGPAVY